MTGQDESDIEPSYRVVCSISPEKNRSPRNPQAGKTGTRLAQTAAIEGRCQGDNWSDFRPTAWKLSNRSVPAQVWRGLSARLRILLWGRAQYLHYSGLKDWGLHLQKLIIRLTRSLKEYPYNVLKRLTTMTWFNGKKRSRQFMQSVRWVAWRNQNY